MTGGIGSGKSAVAARLAERGAVLIDSDRIAREVVAPGTDGAGRDRRRLLRPGAGPPTARWTGRRWARWSSPTRPPVAGWRQITHPRVRARTAELAAAAHRDAVVVNDVPLLVEVGLAPTYHLVVVVQTAVATRLARLARDRGMDRAEAERRIAAQADDARRRAAADVVLTNDGSLDELHAAVDALWRDRLLPYEEQPARAAGGPRRTRSALTEADPTWPQQYARLAARIRHALAPADLRIDHVGSTAVPGLAGQDVIDVQVTVPSPRRRGRRVGRSARRAPGSRGCPGHWWDDPAPGRRRPVGEAAARRRRPGPGRFVCTCGWRIRPVGGTPC